MTKINTSSDVGTELVVLPSDQFKAHTFIAGSGHYPTPRILAALGAVPREDFDKAVALSEERQSALEGLDMNPWKARAQEARAERDALAATVERVRALLPDLDAVIPYDHGNATANRVGELIRAALDPKPTFVLPTEVPARIEARPDWIPDDEDGAMTLNLWTDGKDLCWSTEDGDTGYTPDQVMEQFTEHRLLGADE